jgi:putative heme-binding domain-containing protein
MSRLALSLSVLLIASQASFATAQTPAHTPGPLEKQLLAEGLPALAEAARVDGDFNRGAILFYQPHMACRKCHVFGDKTAAIGPDLARFEKKVDDAYLVEAVLHPSKVIRKGFETITIVTGDGKSFTGLLAEEKPDAIVLRDATQPGKRITIAKADIEERVSQKVSVMPAGLVNMLGTRQQFLDLTRYVMEIAAKGPSRELELRPNPSLYAARPLPEYEKHIDHAGLIADLDKDSFKKGEAIYNRLCINCHGTHDRPGSLPTSLKFASGKFKNGHDPYSMYQTLTRGFGMMVGQSWMVPEQKYDVIHYIREAYLKPRNATQYAKIEDSYLARLPKGDTRGPKPTNITPWINMDYGSSLIASYEVGNDGANFAYKGIATRLDAGPGGVSRGRHWMVFDHDTLRVAAGWSGQGFIDWNGIMFNGRHAIHPRLVGDVAFANPAGPGWANPETGSFDDPRFKGRDDKPYGPLPRKWAQYKGLYHHGNRTIVSYTVGNAPVMETSGLQDVDKTPVFTRSFEIGPRDRDMVLQVAHRPGSKLSLLSSSNDATAVRFGSGSPSAAKKPVKTTKGLVFDGRTYLEIAKADDFDMTEKSYSIYARIRTRKGGTIFAKTPPQDKWVPDGKTLFVRGERLAFDIGWVGTLQSQTRVNDGKPHDVVAVYDREKAKLRLYVDGKLEADGNLQPKKRPRKQVVRIGYTAPNFPRPQTFFDGELDEVRFYQRALKRDDLESITEEPKPSTDLIGRWVFKNAGGETVENTVGKKHVARVQRGTPQVSSSSPSNGALLAGTVGLPQNNEWLATPEGNLRLKIPAGEKPLNFTLWITPSEGGAKPDELSAAIAGRIKPAALKPLTKGGPPRWPDVLKTQPTIGEDKGPFAVDVLTDPVANPWFCRMRLTGHDFLPGGKQAAVSTWDGDVWMVTGIDTPEKGLSWRRIASGLFQPLGVKYVNGKIFLSCRDQICILHDLNGDGETDFYESFNNDHQVTEHFHEFAMGLQTDEAGNFYYAKSARHAKTALVPHHGTLLRVTKDGSKTDIIANGFRAANGVCLNPDGTFIVTDQEGHWNPKNRINWVKPGGFYGNMFGYHDVTDTSDAAMQQPLCWITNSFDRSPAELLWVDSKAWGPLDKSLLNFSYGYGKIYVVPHEDVGGQMQGGMCELPLPKFPTGIMRGRFHPGNGQLYGCGMFAWAGTQQQSGGFYRIRYTGKPVHLPTGLSARKTGMQITLSGDVDRATAENPANYAVKTWSLKRTANYGSKHYDEQRLEITAAKLSKDGRTVLLEIPDIKPTWCMEIRYSIRGSKGEPVDGVIHNTIHKLR